MVVTGSELRPRVDDLVVLHGTVLTATPDGLLRSPDGGETWTRRNLGLAASVSALAAAPHPWSVVLAATPLGIYRSPDAGESWEAVSGVPGQHPLDSIEFLPGTASVLFATTAQGLLTSEDAGRSWLRREEGLPRMPVAGLALHPDGRRLFASDFRSGRLFHSTDAGRTWQAFTTDGLGSKRIWALAVDPSDPDRLLASSASGGLHVLALPTLRAEAPGPPSAPPARNQR